MKYPYTKLLTSVITYTIALAITVTHTGCANLTTILGLAATIIAGLSIHDSIRTIHAERTKQ